MYGRDYMKFTIKNSHLVLGIIAVSALPFVLWSTFDTEHSHDFSRSAWGEVNVGMSESEVKSIVGEPLSVHQWISGKTKTLNYSKSLSDNSNYVHYYLVIQNDTVAEKKKEIFWD